MGPGSGILPQQFRRSALFGLVLLAGGLVAAYKIAGFIVADDTTGLWYVALAIAGCGFIVAIFNNWRNGLYLFLAWLLFEDFARKYLGNNMAIFFAKDVLVLAVYVSFFLAYRRKEVPLFRPPFLVPLLLLVWMGFAQIFNPASTHIVYGLLGFKLFFYYVPLFFVGYALLNSEADLRRFFFVNLVLAGIIVSLGIAQAILGHTFLNPTSIADEIRELSTNYRVAPISGATLYRPNSVFVSTGRFSNFLMVTWLLVLGFVSHLLLRQKRGRFLAFAILALTAAAIALCSSRGVVLWCTGSTLIGSLAFFWGAPWRQGEVVRVLRSLQRTVMGTALGIALIFFFFPEALLSRVAFYSETLLPSSSASQLQFRSWQYPLDNFLGAFGYERWPYGYGIGITSLGTQYVAKYFHAKPPVGWVESGFGDLVVEMGIGGLILWLVMSFAIVISAWRVVRTLRGSPWFPIAFMIFWYAGLLLLPMTFSAMQAYEDFLMNAYLWLLLGILFRLPSIALSAQFATVASQPLPYKPRIA